jgi:ubiquinone/menaquinone biosynthesis C-methylase UbiE
VTAWYEASFRREYLSLYPHRNDDEARSDVANIVRLVDPPRDEPLLDLCCGAGRHLVALRRAGFAQLTGLDLSEDLLDEATRRLQSESITDIRLIHADMREIPEQMHFATILSLFTSFGYFDCDAEDARVLRTTYRALRPGGTFLLDTLNRGHIIASLVPEEESRLGSKRISIRRRISAGGARVEKKTRVTQPGSPETVYRESVRMYTQDELATMLTQAGFATPHFYGGLDGRPYDLDSPRLVLYATREE